MTTTAAQATAAAATAKIGGKDYLLSPLSDQDWAELDLWYQGRAIRRARASLDSDSTETERRLTMEEAFRYAQGLSFLRDALDPEKSPINTVEGVAQLAWRMIREKNRRITADDVRREIAADPGAIAEIMDAFLLMVGLKKTGPAEAESQPTVGQSTGV